MIKKILLMLMLCSFSVFGVKYHQDSRGVEIHTPFRWIVADSTARMALSVAAADTQKFCFQLADTTIWLLSDDSPKRWTWVSGKKVDSLFVSNVLKATRVTADSATIPVLKGHTTKRDSTTFTGGIRGVRLSMDSIFNLTGTAGYVQYLSNSKKLINAPIYTDGSNIAVGKNSVITWQTDKKAIQIGNNAAIMTARHSSGGTHMWLLGNMYYDTTGAWKPHNDGVAWMLRNGDNGWTFYFNSGLTANTAFTPVSIMSLSNAGVLNIPSLTASRAVITDGSKNIVSSAVTSTELGYLSGKNSVIDGSGTSGNIPVFTGSGRIGNGPAYNSGTGTITGNITGKADTARAAYKADTARAAYKADTSKKASIADTAKKAGTATNVSGGTVNATTGTFSSTVSGTTFNSGLGATEIPVYTSGTFNCSLLVSDVKSMQYATAHYEKIGNKVTITFPAMTDTSNSAGLIIYFGSAFTTYNIIPIGWTTVFPALTVDNDNTKQEYFIYNKSNSYNCIYAMSSYASSGTKGYWYDFTITYIAQ